MCKKYPVSGEVELKHHKGTGLTYVEELGISAMAVSIDGTPVAVRGSLFLNPSSIEHDPKAFKAGVLRINS